MTSLSTLLAIFVLSLAAASDVSMQGHTLRLFPVDHPEINWITQDDVESAQKVTESDGQQALWLHFKPDASKRLLSVTSANIGKNVRFIWDGKTVSEMTIHGAFGRALELPAPST
jgi:preprotein translocase subunit SecD